MNVRIRVAMAGAVALAVTLGIPQLAQAADGSVAHAVRGLVASASTAKAAGEIASGGGPSGSDASCPAATSAAAGSATVGAPQRVRAIGGSASATVVWCPPATGAGSVVSLLATASYGPSGPGRHTLINTAPVQVPASSLSATFDNTGITNDSNTNPSPGFAGFDGIGTTYSAQGLAADGLTPGATVSAGGHTFGWPNVPPAQPDNTVAQGQTIAVSGPGSASSLGFLVAANNSAETGTGTIYYTDGSSQGVHA